MYCFKLQKAFCNAVCMKGAHSTDKVVGNCINMFHRPYGANLKWESDSLILIYVEPGVFFLQKPFSFLTQRAGRFA